MHLQVEFTKSYVDYVGRLAKGDFSAVFNVPVTSTMIQTLLHYLPDEQDDTEKFKIICEYFNSEHFSEIPRNWIGARIFAVFKDKVKNEAYTNWEKAVRRLSGFLTDVNHVSTYIPYCDAFIMDQPMAEIVGDSRLNIEERYNVKIFSLNNWQSFLDWLDSTETGLTDEQKQDLCSAYPWFPANEI